MCKRKRVVSYSDFFRKVSDPYPVLLTVIFLHFGQIKNSTSTAEGSSKVVKWPFLHTITDLYVDEWMAKRLWQYGQVKLSDTIIIPFSI